MPDAQGNGHAPMDEVTTPINARETIARQLEAEVARCRERKDALDIELSTVNDELKAFQQALLRLRGEPLIKHAGRGPYKPRKTANEARVRATPSGVGADKLEAIKQTIFTYSLEYDEFRQVDIRAASGDDSSGRMAHVFEALRQQGLIRFSRKDGLSKCFRLTTEGLRERDEAMANVER